MLSTLHQHVSEETKTIGLLIGKTIRLEMGVIELHELLQLQKLRKGREVEAENRDKVVAVARFIEFSDRFKYFGCRHLEKERSAERNKN
jgi:hypothetical protein